MLTPKLSAVTFAAARFPRAGVAGAEQLEAIPQSVVCGFEWGIDARDLGCERRLELVEPEQRGFAYEGATMAFTVLRRDGRRPRPPHPGPAARPGPPHIFLAYIGIGFAMARLPRPLWKRSCPT